MLKKTRLILPAALLAVGVAAFAQDAVTLTRKFKEGDTIRFKTTVNASVMGGEAVVTTTSKQTVKKVKENGEVVVSIMDEGGKLSFGGAEQDIPGGAEIVETRGKNGRISRLEFPSGGQEIMTPEIRELMSLIPDVIFSDKAVKAGDAWEAEADNPAVKGKKIAFKSSFVGVEKVGEVAAWKVKQNAEALTDDKGAKLSSEYVYWLDPATGHLIKSQAKVDGIPTQFGVMSWTSKIERIKDEEKKAF